MDSNERSPEMRAGRNHMNAGGSSPDLKSASANRGVVSF